MEKKLLQRQLSESAAYYVSESQQYRKIKTNVLLVIAILGVCFVVRLTDKHNAYSIDGSTKQQYFDVPSHTATTNLSFTQAA